jgi:hypothetical protein
MIEITSGDRENRKNQFTTITVSKMAFTTLSFLTHEIYRNLLKVKNSSFFLA